MCLFASLFSDARLGFDQEYGIKYDFGAGVATAAAPLPNVVPDFYFYLPHFSKILKFIPPPPAVTAFFTKLITFVDQFPIPFQKINDVINKFFTPPPSPPRPPPPRPSPPPPPRPPPRPPKPGHYGRRSLAATMTSTDHTPAAPAATTTATTAANATAAAAPPAMDVIANSTAANASNPASSPSTLLTQAEQQALAIAKIVVPQLFPASLIQQWINLWFDWRCVG